MTLCNLALPPATPGFEKLGVAGDEVNVTSIFANLKQAQVIKVLDKINEVWVNLGCTIDRCIHVCLM